MLAVNPSSPERESWFRLRYGKDAELRFLGHRDTMQLILRLLRRAQLPLALTGGYSPHPRLVWGPPLPLGFISSVEFLDFALQLQPNDQPVMVAKGSYERLRKAQQTREIVLGVHPLQAQEPRISRLATSARYRLLFVNEKLQAALTAQQLEAWLEIEAGAMAGANRNALNHHRSGSPLPRGLRSWEVRDGVLCLNATVSGREALPLSRLVKMLAAHTGLRFLIGERTGLYDTQGDSVE